MIKSFLSGQTTEISDRCGTCLSTQPCDEWGLRWQYLTPRFTHFPYTAVEQADIKILFAVATCFPLEIGAIKLFAMKQTLIQVILPRALFGQ